MVRGNDIDLDEISMKKRKCEKKRVNKRKIKIIMGGDECPLAIENILLEDVVISEWYYY